MMIERVRHSGALQVSGEINGRFVTRTYYGYTWREAVAEWRELDPAYRAKRLQREAVRSCQWRGHRMRWQTVTRTEARIVRRGACRTCGAEVTIDTRPEANGIDVGGAAVAVACTRRRVSA